MCWHIILKHQRKNVIYIILLGGNKTFEKISMYFTLIINSLLLVFWVINIRLYKYTWICVSIFLLKDIDFSFF